jgi:protein-S-isoprenylcysteine O-methyltransferase Ste14
MSLVPAFEIGVWNAWILILLMFLTYVPGQLTNKEAMNKVNEGWASEKWTKTEKLLANSTHFVIIPLTVIYSIFLPLKLGTVWFYVGIPIYFIGSIMNLMVGINIATIPFDNEPITKGVYRFSRHPAYFGGFLIFLGIGIACASCIYILFAVAWIVMWHIAVPAEERSLLKKYGNTYREYMNKTPRWIGIPRPEKS